MFCVDERSGQGCGRIKMHNTPASQEQAETAEQVRTNIAFEHMVFAVLAGAFVGGTATLFFGIGSAVIRNAFSMSVLVSVLLNTLLVSFLIFLVGFFTSLVVGAPLFSALEKTKRRNLWPYLGAALAVAIIVIAVIYGGIPVADDFSFGIVLGVVLPAVVIAFSFVRSMQPHWRAADKEEAFKLRELH